MTTPVFVDVSPAEGVVGAPRAILSAQIPSGAQFFHRAHPSMPAGRTPGSRRMGFFVPSPHDDAGAALPPADGSGVAVVQAEARTSPCTSFAGYATDGECARQLEKLLAALERDGVASADGAAGKYSVLQYNPPQTLPFLRGTRSPSPSTRRRRRYRRRRRRRDAAAAEEAALAEAAAAEAAAAEAVRGEAEAEAPGDVEMEVEAEPEEAPVDVEMAEEVSSDVDDDFIEGDLV